MALRIQFMHHEDRSRLHDAATKAHVALAADGARFAAEHGATIAAAGGAAAVRALAVLRGGRPGWSLAAVAALETLAQNLDQRERCETDQVEALLAEIASTLRALIRSGAVLAVLDQIFILGVSAPMSAGEPALVIAIVET